MKWKVCGHVATSLSPFFTQVSPNVCCFFHPDSIWKELPGVRDRPEDHPDWCGRGTQYTHTHTHTHTHKHTPPISNIWSGRHGNRDIITAVYSWPFSCKTAVSLTDYPTSWPSWFSHFGHQHLFTVFLMDLPLVGFLCGLILYVL